MKAGTCMEREKRPAFYLFIESSVRFFYRKYTVEGAENLPEEPCIAVGNHSQAHGPIVSQLYFPRAARTWCIGEMMHTKEVPAYAFKDFWSMKPKWTLWFWKIASFVIAPLAAYVMSNAWTIGVYKDKRIFNTLKETTEKLQEGYDIIIYPECYEEHNNIVHNFQTGFVEVARLYGRKTKKSLPFVPMYLCPSLKKLIIGKPIYYDLEADKKEEADRICNYLMDEISEMAYKQEPHTVVPYPNISKKDYPKNIRIED